MELRWDERKNRINLRKHGFGFELASEVFRDPFCITQEDRLHVGELRYKTVGRLENLSVIVVIHTTTEEMSGEIRIISARKATPSERKFYETES